VKDLDLPDLAQQGPHARHPRGARCPRGEPWTRPRSRRASPRARPRQAGAWLLAGATGAVGDTRSRATGTQRDPRSDRRGDPRHCRLRSERSSSYATSRAGRHPTLRTRSGSPTSTSGCCCTAAAKRSATPSRGTSVRPDQPVHIGGGIRCTEAIELVTLHLDDALDDRDRRLFERHVDACTGCTRYVAQIRQTIDLHPADARAHERRTSAQHNELGRPSSLGDADLSEADATKRWGAPDRSQRTRPPIKRRATGGSPATSVVTDPTRSPGGGRWSAAGRR
jgi:Putative zinc-finger